MAQPTLNVGPLTFLYEGAGYVTVNGIANPNSFIRLWLWDEITDVLDVYSTVNTDENGHYQTEVVFAFQENKYLVMLRSQNDTDEYSVPFSFYVETVEPSPPPNGGGLWIIAIALAGAAAVIGYLLWKRK